jgi:hypothetical protein
MPRIYEALKRPDLSMIVIRHYASGAKSLIYIKTGELKAGQDTLAVIILAFNRSDT